MTANQTTLSSREYLEQVRARRQQRVLNQPIAQAKPEAAASPQPSATDQAGGQPAQAPEAAEPKTYSDQARNSNSSQRQRESNLIPGQMRPIKEETLLEWVAPSRPFKKRNRQFYSTVGIITLLVSLILFFIGQFLPIAVAISVAFLTYVLYSIPPDKITNKITTYGLRQENNLYYWEELGRFWFEKKYTDDLLHIEVARFPNRITLLLGDQTRDELRDILNEVLLEEKPADTFIDKSAKWLQEKVPLE